jgi:signal transduction histidine kinase
VDLGHDRGVGPRSNRWQRVADWAIPWGVGIFLLLVVLEDRDDPGNRDALDALGLVLAVAPAYALRYRRRYPERTLVVALAGTLGFVLLYPDVVIPVAGLFAIFALAALRPRAQSIPWLAALLAVTAVNLAVAKVDDSIFALALVVTAWALGESTRSRRVAISEESKRAVADEQARIARELHDVVAHSVSVIVVQAAAADDVFDERPDQARASLRAIESSGRDALGELRLLLNGVRPGTEHDPHRPQPGLGDLDALIAPLRESGLEVSVRREGSGPLPAGVDLSAYRIVQEALTNTLRHARATRADVVVTHRTDSVELDVRDDGIGAAANGEAGGHGLVGMHERAALLGGRVDTGPLAGGGYRVHAVLPVAEAP